MWSGEKVRTAEAHTLRLGCRVQGLWFEISCVGIWMLGVDLKRVAVFRTSQLLDDLTLR